MSNAERWASVEAAAMGRPRLVRRDERIARLEAALREIVEAVPPVPDDWPQCDEANWQRVRDLVVPHGIRLDIMVGNVTRFNLRSLARIATAALEATP